MQTKVSERGQIAIPAKIRKAYNIKKNTRIEWVEEEGKIYMVPLPENPVKALRGAFKGILSTKDLLKERNIERMREKFEKGE